MKKFSNAVAVVTGAGSGIGRHLSYQLARAGAKVAISDINAKNLEETKSEILSIGAQVTADVLDVSDQKAFFDYAEHVNNHFGPTNLVINNAGVALASGDLINTDIEDFKWVMDINFYGVLYGTKAFLPQMANADWGHIVNISSIFGIISVPEQAAYNASKFAVRGMTEALRQELDASNSHISCTTVHPGGIKTNIARSAKVTKNSALTNPQEREKAFADFDKIARTSPESAADQILKAVLQDKRKLLIGADAKLIDKIQRIFPRHYGRFLDLLFGQKS